jgi:hypothetical protein
VNILSAKIALRDRTLLDVLDLALRFMVAHWRAFTKMSAVVTVPCFLVTWQVALHWGWYAGWASAFVLSGFAEAPYVALASRLVFDERVRTREALLVTLRALPRLTLLRVLQLASIGAASFFFLVPGIWLAALFFFGTEVVVLERASATGSVGRLQRLGTGYFGDVVMALLSLSLLYVLAIALGDATGHAILEELLQIRLRPSAGELGGPIALLSAWLAVPTLTVARFFVYLNLRTRREGWDIQTRFAAIAARAAAEQEAA